MRCTDATPISWGGVIQRYGRQSTSLAGHLPGSFHVAGDAKWHQQLANVATNWRQWAIKVYRKLIFPVNHSQTKGKHARLENTPTVLKTWNKLNEDDPRRIESGRHDMRLSMWRRFVLKKVRNHVLLSARCSICQLRQLAASTRLHVNMNWFTRCRRLVAWLGIHVTFDLCAKMMLLVTRATEDNFHRIRIFYDFPSGLKSP